MSLFGRSKARAPTPLSVEVTARTVDQAASRLYITGLEGDAALQHEVEQFSEYLAAVPDGELLRALLFEVVQTRGDIRALRGALSWQDRIRGS